MREQITLPEEDGHDSRRTETAESKEPTTKEPARKEPAKPAKKAKVVDIVKPKPAKETDPEESVQNTAKSVQKPKENAHEAAENAHEAAENAHEENEYLPDEEAEGLSADIINKDDEELQKAKKIAETPMTPEQAILGEIWRLYRILGESIEEQNWARVRGSAGTLIEHAARIEKEQRQKEEEEDKTQMKFEDFPELMPGSGDDAGEQEEG